MQQSLGVPRRWSRMALGAAVVLLAGLPAFPAACAPGASGDHPSSESENADMYVLSIGDNLTSTNISIDEWVRVRERRTGDFLWFRRGGKAYLIQDPATLQQAHALFAPLRALEPEQEDLRRREEAFDEKEQDLDREGENLERQLEQLDRSAETEEGAADEEEGADEMGETEPPTDTERDELRDQIAKIRGQQQDHQASNRELEDVERSLESREEALEKEAESKLWTLIDAAVKKGLAKASAKL